MKYMFSEIVKSAFHQRRKTILNSTRAVGIDCTQLNACGIDTKARAEQITVEQYVRLANMLAAQ